MTKTAKITKEMIDEVAFAIMREEGFDGLTARNVAEKVGCSTQPIYKIYGGLDGLKESVMGKVGEHLYKMIYQYQKTNNKFLNTGLGFIQFARTEKVLFRELVIENKLHQTLFGTRDDDTLFRIMDEDLGLVNLAEFSNENKETLFTDTMIYTLGLASLVYADQLNLNEEQIAEHLIRFTEKASGGDWTGKIKFL